MKKENTSTRLKTIIKDRGLKQIDILNKALPFCQKYGVKMNKSDISQYVSGKNEPGQDKLYILGKALNVSEAWLMGFDVPMERTASTKEESPKIMQYYEMLNDIGKHEAEKRVEELTHLQKYTEEGEHKNNIIEFSEELTPTKDYLIPNAAHDRTDTEVTEDMKKHDDAFFDED